MLLEPNVRTYGEAATRLGISEDAMKKTMQRVMNRYSAAKAYSGTIERWKVKRKGRQEGEIQRSADNLRVYSTFSDSSAARRPVTRI